MRLRYSWGISVFEAARSKKSLTCSRKRGSLNSSSLGPKLAGSMLAAFFENKADSKVQKVRNVSQKIEKNAGLLYESRFVAFSYHVRALTSVEESDGRLHLVELVDLLHFL
jgi:hypothetical protein